MKELVIVGCEFFSIAIPLMVVYGVLRVLDAKKGIEKRRGHFYLLLALAVYVTGVFYFTGAGTVYHIRQYGFEWSINQINLIPFSAQDIDIVSYLLNVVLFIPLGVLLPLLWPGFNRLRSVLLFGLLFSLWIETSQLLNIRNSDIDDLLLNTLGAVVGFLLFRLYAGLTKQLHRTETGRNWEAILYFAAMLTGYFLTFHEFGLAKILYGF